jgi:hypothetical protein
MVEANGIPIDPSLLEISIARLLGEPILKISDWQIKPLGCGIEVNNRLFLVSGQARTASGEQPWWLVLKTVQRDPSTDSTPQAVRYWKREALFYQSGILDDRSSAVFPPRCFQVTQQDELTLIWMEAV